MKVCNYFLDPAECNCDGDNVCAECACLTAEEAAAVRDWVNSIAPGVQFVRWEHQEVGK